MVYLSKSLLFSIIIIHLHSVIISWCVIGTAAKETVLEMIRNTKSMVVVIIRSLPKLYNFA